MKQYPFHTLLLAVFPVIFLYSINYSETPVSDTFAPTVLILLIFAILYLFLWLVLKNGRKAGLIVSLMFLLFFSFGPIAEATASLKIWKLLAHQRRYIMALEGLVFIAGAFLLTRARGDLKKLTYILNIIAIVLVLNSAVLIAYNQFRSSGVRTTADIPEIVGDIPEQLPDIYYIILDAYARSDILKNIFNMDNSGFIDYLENKGFFVGEKSRSNYGQTLLSLPSSLNMTYLDDIAALMGKETSITTPLVRMTKTSTVCRFLKQLGYKTIAVSSGFYIKNIINADTILLSSSGLSNFQHLLLGMTPIPTLLFRLRLENRLNETFRSYIINSLDKLGNIPSIDRPAFIFAHVVAPHVPFLYDADGNELDPEDQLTFFDSSSFTSVEEFRHLYADYVRWLNGELMGIVDNILSNSAIDPIIILQADHGINSYLLWGDSSDIGMTERMAILNAIYLPDTACVGLYDQITPVNSFRVIFNCCFGTRMDILDDRSYFSRYDSPYDFIDVTERTSKPFEIDINH